MSGVQIPIDRRRFNNGVIALLWKQISPRCRSRLDHAHGGGSIDHLV